VVEYTTVYRFVRKIIRSKASRNLKSISPPQAIVSFAYCGKLVKNKKKIGVWMFCMQLTGSSYRFYQETRHADIATFINCHVKAFVFLRGIPHLIHLNYIDRSLIQTDSFFNIYGEFLKYFGAKYSDEHLSFIKEGSCHSLFNESFFKSIINKEYSQFTKELERWFTRLNLDKHPILKLVIKKAFEQQEQPFLLSLPQNPYPTTGTCIRKVNERGYVFFEYNWYQVPKEYLNKYVTVTFYDREVKILFEQKLIALHMRSYSQKTKIKLV
jgi:hypothetical protein